MKVAIDIFKGIQDTDAKYLAEKLEFKGPLLDEVISLFSTIIIAVLNLLFIDINY